MNCFAIICFVIWCYFLSVFKRGKLDFFKYITGSVGLFVFMMIFLEQRILPTLINVVVTCSGIIGNFTGLFEAYPDYDILFVNCKKTGESLSLYVDYECSGVIEIMAFISLLAFFEVYEKWQRIVVAMLGTVAIFLANVIRITVICLIIKLWGNDAYYIAHTIVGRLVFYAMSIFLYYYVFTHAQIIKQKIGGFKYESSDKPSD